MYFDDKLMLINKIFVEFSNIISKTSQLPFSVHPFNLISPLSIINPVSISVK